MKRLLNISKWVAPLVLWVLIPLGCDVGGSDEELLDTSSPVRDRDGDFWDDERDCDPDDPNVYPGAPLDLSCAPDGVDNDCDGLTDEDDTACEVDTDTNTDIDTDSQTS